MRLRGCSRGYLVPHKRGAATAQGVIEAPSDEELTDTEMQEAWFRLIEAAHRGQPRPGAASLEDISLTSIGKVSDVAPARHMSCLVPKLKLWHAITSLALLLH